MAPQTMQDIIDFAAETYGDAPALRYKVRREIMDKSYSQLKHDIEAFSRALDRMSLRGAHVAVIGPTSYEWIVAFFGVANSGGVVVPLDASLPAEDLCELIRRADVRALVYDELRADVAALAHTGCPALELFASLQADAHTEEGHAFRLLLEENAGEFHAELDPDALCAILFTSGTTGISKGVMLTHRGLTDNAVCLDLKIPAGTVSMTLLPIHHAYCLTMDIIKGLYIGLTICINDSIMHVQKNMKLFKPEMMLLVPMVIETVYKQLQAAGSLIPKKMVAKAAFGGRLHTVCSGGAYLDPALVGAFAEYGITILQGYGMTECSPVISTNLPWESKAGSVGKLMPNCEAKVVDEELWVRGSSVMLGYYQMPEETAQTLVDGWLRTGDLGYVDEDKFVYITGRCKNLIILKNGENVSPEELENALLKSPLIQEVIVSEHENVIGAEIFPDEDYAHKKHIKDVPAEIQAVIDAFNAQTPPYKRIAKITLRDTEFPKTAAKKIKRNYAK